MKYYIVTLDRREVHVPVITNWYNTVPVQSFFKGRTWEVPFRNLLMVRDCGWEPNYLKLLFSPFPLVHDSLLPVFEAYGFNCVRKQMIFLDIAYRKSELYYLMQLFRAEGRIEHGDQGTLIVCERRSIADLDAFHIMDGQKCLLVCSLAIIESLLREGVMGIHLEPVIIEEEET